MNIPIREILCSFLDHMQQCSGTTLASAVGGHLKCLGDLVVLWASIPGLWSVKHVCQSFELSLWPKKQFSFPPIDKKVETQRCGCVPSSQPLSDELEFELRITCFVINPTAPLRGKKMGISK